MTKHLLSIVATIVSVLSFTGCQSSRPAPKEVEKYTLEENAPVVLLGPGVQTSVTSLGTQQTTLPDGRLEVVAKLQNRENRRIQVQVQCEFKDAQGFPIDSTSWVNQMLTELSVEGVKFVSMNDKAKRFTIRVREAH